MTHQIPENEKVKNPTQLQKINDETKPEYKCLFFQVGIKNETPLKEAEFYKLLKEPKKSAIIIIV